MTTAEGAIGGTAQAIGGPFDKEGGMFLVSFSLLFLPPFVTRGRGERVVK